MKLNVNDRQHDLDVDPRTPLLYVLRDELKLAERKVTTLEGLGTAAEPAPIQRAFIEVQAAQCGYCIPGMMMRAHALLQKQPQASDAEIQAWLEPHLCRCGTHMRILRAIRLARSLMMAAQAGDRR